MIGKEAEAAVARDQWATRTDQPTETRPPAIHRRSRDRPLPHAGRIGAAAGRARCRRLRPAPAMRGELELAAEAVAVVELAIDLHQRQRRHVVAGGQDVTIDAGGGWIAVLVAVADVGVAAEQVRRHRSGRIVRVEHDVAAQHAAARQVFPYQRRLERRAARRPVWRSARPGRCRCRRRSRQEW